MTCGHHPQSPSAIWPESAFLSKPKGLAEKTIAYRGCYLHRLLNQMFSYGHVIHSKMNTASIEEYVLSQLAMPRPQTVKGLISATLHSYFQFFVPSSL